MYLALESDPSALINRTQVLTSHILRLLKIPNSQLDGQEASYTNESTTLLPPPLPARILYDRVVLIDEMLL